MSESVDYEGIEMKGVREHGHGMEVLLKKSHGRLVVEAANEGGMAMTCVDLIDVIEWVKKHRPELLTSQGN